MFSYTSCAFDKGHKGDYLDHKVCFLCATELPADSEYKAGLPTINYYLQEEKLGAIQSRLSFGDQAVFMYTMSRSLDTTECLGTASSSGAHALGVPLVLNNTGRSSDANGGTSPALSTTLVVVLNDSRFSGVSSSGLLARCSLGRSVSAGSARSRLGLGSVSSLGLGRLSSL